MKLILIRHLERTDDIGFFSELTEKGLYDAKYIMPKELNKITDKVDAIFSSTFYFSRTIIFFHLQSKFIPPFVRLALSNLAL